MAKQSKHNPQGDDDVEQGYQKHQQAYKDQQAREEYYKEREKQNTKPDPHTPKDDQFEVDSNATTVVGTDKDEN